MQESQKWKWSLSVVPDSSWPHGLQPTRLLCPWDFPGMSTGVGCHCYLLFDHFQFMLIHELNIPGSYAIFFFIALDFVWPPVTSITVCCFHFGSASSFFLELFLPSSPVAHWAPTILGSSSFSVIPFFLFMGFSRQEWWSGLLSPSPRFIRTLHHDPSVLSGPTWYGS